MSQGIYDTAEKQFTQNKIDRAAEYAVSQAGALEATVRRGQMAPSNNFGSAPSQVGYATTAPAVEPMTLQRLVGSAAEIEKRTRQLLQKTYELAHRIDGAPTRNGTPDKPDNCDVAPSVIIDLATHLGVAHTLLSDLYAAVERIEAAVG